MVGSSELIQELPPISGKRVLIDSQQGIFEIITEVLRAHDYFKPDYDRICKFFDLGSVEQICKSLFNFCKENIRYEIETEDYQTTRSPGRLLFMGAGDCKHYAGFIGGVLCALNRNYDRKIDWFYRFASYNLIDKDPAHVFVIVENNGVEYWIDPVLETFDQRSPYPWYYIDKRPKMALHRLSGIDSSVAGTQQPQRVGIAWLAIAATAYEFIRKYSDKVPNYPIKSGNTYDKLKGIVETNVFPLPPLNLADANSALDKALYWREWENGGDGGAANQTIKMMYDEVIAALRNYIATGGNQPVNTPYDSPNQLPNPNPNPNPNPQPTQAGFNPWIMALLAGGVLFMANKKKSPAKVHGAGNLMLPILIAGGVFLLVRKSQISGKRSELKTLDPSIAAIVDQMSDSEIADTYEWVKLSLANNQAAASQSLKNSIAIIGAKYKIFT